MVIIAVLVLMWIAVLAPALLRKLRSFNSEHSISTFHHSLRLLEPSGPKAIVPAFRLDTGSTTLLAAPRMVPLAPSSPIEPRPQLVLLQPDGKGGVATMDHRAEYYDDSDDRGYGRSGYDDSDRSADYEADYEADYHVEHRSASAGRSGAALRRRNILFGLIASVFITALGGFVVSTLWMLTMVCFVLLVAYIGLMAYAATRGTIAVGGLGARSRLAEERHVARAVVPGPGYRAAPEFAYSDEHDPYAEQADWGEAPGERWSDEGFWDEPRRAVAR